MPGTTLKNISTIYIMIGPCNIVSAPPLQCFTGGAASPGSALSQCGRKFLGGGVVEASVAPPT